MRRVGRKNWIITILDGEGALNNIRQRDAREPVVQVTDENHKPVAGVALLFLIHDGAKGGSASFNGASSFATTTGPDGVAKTTGLQVGRTPGTYTITVTATLGAIVATTIIHQGNIISALNPPSGPEQQRFVDHRAARDFAYGKDGEVCRRLGGRCRWVDRGGDRYAEQINRPA